MIYIVMALPKKRKKLTPESDARPAARKTVSTASKARPATKIDQAFELIDELSPPKAGPGKQSKSRAKKAVRRKEPALPMREVKDGSMVFDSRRQPKEKAQQLIRDSMFGTAAVTLVPLPLLDLVLVTAVQLNMMERLARYYGKSFTPKKGSWLIAGLTGTSVLGTASITLGTSLLKVIPGFGSGISALTNSVSCGALTYALGQVLALFFERGGNLTDFILEEHEALFREKLSEGERVVKAAAT
jgi:uncharacterized protein (DUF697 family)